MESKIYDVSPIFLQHPFYLQQTNFPVSPGMSINSVWEEIICMMNHQPHTCFEPHPKNATLQGVTWYKQSPVMFNINVYNCSPNTGTPPKLVVEFHRTYGDRKTSHQLFSVLQNLNLTSQNSVPDTSSILAPLHSVPSAPSTPSSAPSSTPSTPPTPRPLPSPFCRSPVLVWTQIQRPMECLTIHTDDLVDVSILEECFSHIIQMTNSTCVDTVIEGATEMIRVLEGFPNAFGIFMRDIAVFPLLLKWMKFKNPVLCCCVSFLLGILKKERPSWEWLDLLTKSVKKLIPSKEELINNDIPSRFSSHTSNQMLWAYPLSQLNAIV